MNQSKNIYRKAGFIKPCFTVLFLSLFLAEANGQWMIEDSLSMPTMAFEYMNMVDSGVSWVTGYKGLPPDTPCIYRRTHAIGWKSIPVNGLMYWIEYNCIAGRDSLNAWVGTNTGKVYQTTNGGINWYLIFDYGEGSYVNDIRFSKTEPWVGYIFFDPPLGPGTPFKILKTINNGLNWIEYSPTFEAAYYGTYMSGCVTDSNHAWFGLNCQLQLCNQPRIAYTTNGGLIWSTRLLPGYNDVVLSIEYRSDNLYGFSSVWNIPAIIFNTTNGGVSWTFNYQDTLPIQRIVSVEGTSVWYFNNYLNIFRSTNNGTNWSLMSAPNGNDQIQFMDAVRSGERIYCRAITLNAMVMKFIDTAVTIGIINNSQQIPKEYSLSQNYPNPFNPVTNIKFGIPKQGLVKMIVYDILGREVTLLINEVKLAGTYEVKFDGSNLASGVYFYRIVSGDFVDIKKMVLIK